MYHTQKETLFEVDKIFKIGALQVEKGNIPLEALKAFMPPSSLLFVTKKVDLSPMYICAATEELMEISNATIQQESQNLLYNYNHPTNFNITYPKFIYHAKFGDQEKPFSQFQKFRIKKEGDYFVVRTTVLGSQKYEGLLTIHYFLIISFADWSGKKRLIDNKEIEFAHQNFTKFIKLTERERILLAFLGEGWRPKDIGDHQCTSYENIRKQIKRINEKLELTHSKFNKAAIYSKYVIYFGLTLSEQ